MKNIFNPMFPPKATAPLLLTFDAPPYDPRKTVNLEDPLATK